jgi:putative ABC transport system permease protein
VSIGVSVMIGSFRRSVEVWLERTLSADIYVAPARSGGAGPAAIDPGALERLAREPAVAEVRRYRRGDVATPDGPVDVMAVDVDSRLRGQFDLLAGGTPPEWRAFVAGRAALVSEPFGYRRGVGTGDTLRFHSERGDVDLPVAGVFRDYGSDRGMVMISYAAYRRLWDDSAVTSLALNLRAGAEVNATIDRLRAATAGTQPLSIRAERALREASLEVFDRTFAITQVLRLLALLVAFVAVLSALMALQLERERELGVLRANGLTPRQVWGLVASQTGLMGVAAGVMALPLGLVLAVLMTEVVNRRAFGWTMGLAVPPALLLQALGIALAASLLAGIYPSWRMARTSPAEALRSE